MASETVRIKPETHAKLRELATKAGETMPDTLARAIDALYRQQFLDEVNRAYAALQADPKAWQAEPDERALLEGTLADGLADAGTRTSPCAVRFGMSILSPFAGMSRARSARRW